MKQYRVAVVGFGDRGQVYSDYSLREPKRMRICAVVDPNPYKRQKARQRYGLSEGCLFSCFADFLASGIGCDLVINATMDQIHYETAMQILEAGFDMLMEKPIVPEERSLLEIKALAEKKGVNVFICHVLRYTPFYKAIKTRIQAGAVGSIISVDLCEHVGNWHYLTSYVRGKWRKESQCGSSFLLAKSCHDMDLLCWLNNETVPVRAASFGHRKHFVPEEAPEDAAEYCWQCPREKTCSYASSLLYLEHDFMPFLTWDRLDKPAETLTAAEKEAFLRQDIYGRCAFRTDADILDRQTVMVDFANGSVATFQLIGGCARACRKIHIVGTKGEIEGVFEENRFVLRTVSPVTRMTEEEVCHVDLRDFGGHGGGDFCLVNELLNWYDGDRSSVSITPLADSVCGHLCVYAADRSVKEGRITEIHLEKGS